jgi:hypothetical protein
MPSELWLVVSGGTLIAAAVCWRWCSHRRVRVRLEMALRSGDPLIRQAGIRVAADQGLRRNAKMLLSCIDRESAPEVLHFLAESVLRNSWEPADQPAILRLRLWAHEQHARPAKLTAPRVVGPGTSTTPKRLAPQRPEGAPRHRATDIDSLRVVEEIG